MSQRTSAVVWIALGVGSGVLAESLPGRLAWIPAVAIVGSSFRLGAAAGMGVSAAVLSGATGRRAQLDCRPSPDRGSRWIRGFATVARTSSDGPLRFRLIRDSEAPSRFCARDISVYQHRGRLDPGRIRELWGFERTDRRGGTVFVVDSIRTSISPIGVRARFAPFLVRVRASLDTRIQRAVGPTASPLALALVSGRRGEVQRAVRDDFSRAGTAHLLAISGFHVGVIGGLFALTAAMLGAGPRTRSVSAALLVWGYVAMIGSPASGVRAAGLLTAIGLGRLLGRPTRRLPALAAVFLTCLVLRPDLLGGIGFQLSFAASAGIVLSRTWPDRCWTWISERAPLASVSARGTRASFFLTVVENTVRGATVAVGATLPTVPFVAWHFGTVSLVSVPATLCAMPLAAASIVAVLIAVGIDFLLPFAGPLVGGGAAEVLALLELCVRSWAALPWAAVAVSGATSAAFILAGCMVLVVGRGNTRLPVGVAAIAVSWLSATWVIGGWGSLSNRETVDVIFIDVGQGDAVLVRSPRNRWMLVDAGPATAGWDAGVQRVAPVLNRLGVRDVETMILTHADADHVGGAAAVLSRFTVRTVIDPGRARGTQPFVAALEAAGRRNVPWKMVQAGDRWTFDGVDVEVLSPRKTTVPRSINEESVVVLIRYGQFEALLTGDASTRVERAVLGQLPDALEVLKVGHHGSKTSTASELLDATAPELAVISVGASNRYGHPAPIVLDRLSRYGARILRTDRQGTIRVTGLRDGSFQVTTDR